MNDRLGELRRGGASAAADDVAIDMTGKGSSQPKFMEDFFTDVESVKVRRSSSS